MRDYKTLKEAVKLNLLKVKKDSIQVLQDCVYIIETEDKNFVTIHPIQNSIDCFINFLLEFEEYTVLIDFNDILAAKYDFYEATNNGYKCSLNENSYLFDTNIFQLSSDNANNMLMYFLNGKLGKTGKIRYEDVYRTLKNTMEKSGLPLLESLSYELLVSETVRNEKDPTKPFRLEATPVKQYNFTTIKLKDIGKNVSALTALSSEDITDSISSIVLNKKNNKTTKLTPLEAIALNKL